jgi:hypothetical protein
MCNKELLPDFNPRTTTTTVHPVLNSSQGPMPYIVLFASLFLCLVAFTIIVLALVVMYKRRENKRNRRNRLMNPNFGPTSISPLTNLVEQSSGSGKINL